MSADRRRTLRFYAGLVIAAAGLACSFVGMKAHDHGLIYTGFTVALIGAGIVPVEKIGEFWKR